jgi:hypothetical protein
VSEQQAERAAPSRSLMAGMWSSFIALAPAVAVRSWAVLLSATQNKSQGTRRTTRASTGVGATRSIRTKLHVAGRAIRYSSCEARAGHPRLACGVPKIRKTLMPATTRGMTGRGHARVHRQLWALPSPPWNEVVGEIGQDTRRTERSSTASGNTRDVHTIRREAYFSIFNRGMRGACQHYGEKRLHRHLSEYHFRYNHRTRLAFNDGDRAACCDERGDQAFQVPAIFEADITELAAPVWPGPRIRAL